MNFDDEGLWSTNNNKIFEGDGLFIDAANEQFSLGDRFSYDKGTGDIILSGWKGDVNHLVGGNAANGFTGIQSGNGAIKAFFAGADDEAGSNARFFAQADGKIFSEGIREVLYKKAATAGYNYGDELSVSGPGVSQWKTTVNTSGTNSDTKTEIKLQVQFEKKFSLDTIRLKGFLHYGVTSDGSGVNGYAKCTVKILGESLEDSQQTSISSSPLSLDLSLDIGSYLNNNQLFYAEIILEAHVEGLDGSATTNQATAQLDDDIEFYLTT
ncbi:MAG TPA: hypothetical protein VJ964_10965 [Balneolaceae bacterium]|nr:hypothetical protein [Balneolaceae bacterium]